MDKLSLEEFEDLMRGGQSRNSQKAVTYVLIEDEDGEEIFYAEWEFLSEEHDYEVVEIAHKHYIDGDRAVHINHGKTIFDI